MQKTSIKNLIINSVGVSKSLFVLSLFFMALCILPAFATHTASVTVSPQYVQGEVTKTYTFTVTNNGDDKLKGIVIKFPEDGTIAYSGNLQCPLNWIPIYDSINKLAKCLYDFTDPQYIEKGSSAEVSFDAASASGLSQDTVVTWIVTTYDNAGGSSTNTDATTTVDVTPPTTSDNAPTEWQNSDVTVTLTCNDGDIGSDCKEIHYQICDENGENCGNEQIGTGNSISIPITCSKDSVCKYTIKYYSIDNVDNTENTKTSGVIKIDKKAPVTEVSVGDPKYGTNPTYITSSTQITLSAEDEGSGVQVTYYKIDNGDDQLYSNPITISSEGPHTITYWSEDKAGNVENAKTLSVYVDNSGPTIENIQIEPSYSDGTNLYISGTSTISASVNDGDGSGVASCEYTLDGGINWNFAEYDSENHLCKAENVDTSGATSINFRATDYVENTGKGAAVNVVVDKNAPSISISGNPDDWVNVDRIAQISCEDGNGESGCNSNTIGYKLYDSDPGTCPGDASEYTVGTSVKISSHQWVCAYGEDNVGNSATAGPVEFRVDKIAPTISDDYIYDGIWVNSEQTVSLSPHDEGDSKIKEVKYCEGESCDVSQGTVLYSPYQLTFSDDGIKVIRYQAWDNAGNPSDVGTFTVKIDKTKPITIKITSPSNDDYVKGKITIQADAKDNNGGSGIAKVEFYYENTKIGEDADSPYSIDWDTTKVKDGTYSLTAVAIDKAGNSLTSSAISVTVDNTPPEITTYTIDNPIFSPNNDGVKDTATINLEFSEAVDYTISIKDGEGNTVKSWTGTETSSISKIWDGKDDNENLVSDGVYTIEVVITDKAGNSVTDTSKTVTVDTKAPVVTINTLIINDNTPQLTGTVDDPTATVEVTVGGNTYAATNNGDGTWTADVTDELSDGTYDVSVTATDQAGNIGNDDTSNELTVDTQKPTITNFDEPKNDKVYKGNVPLRFTPHDTGTAVTCSYKIDNNDPASVDCQRDMQVDTTITGLSDGRHHLTLTVTDAAGNSVSDSVSFVVDLDNSLTVGPSGADFTSIQAAIDAASEGDTIEVADGTYDEQIIISKPLTIQGQGDTTIIKPSQTTADNFQLFSRKPGGSDNTAPIVVANADATIKNLKIDGSEVSSVPSGDTMFVGILYRGVNGIIDSVTVEGINIADGNAIYLSSMGNNVNVEVKGSTISNFYKNGITANYEGLTVNIHDNTIIGSGPRDDVAQNGIQIGYGATGSVVENMVSDIAYTGAGWIATGILFVDSSGNARNNIVTNCQAGIVAQAGWYPPVTCDVTIENNTIDASGLTSLSYIAGTGAVTWDENAAITVTIKNNDLTGAGYGEGISIGSEYGDGTVDATIEGNDISNWGHGIWLGPTSNQIVITNNNIINNVEVDSGIHIVGVDVSCIKINFNNIEGNAAYGVYNDGSGILDAEFNYWGCADGPGSEGCDAVSENVDYDPWLKASKDDAPVRENGAPTGYVNTDTLTLSLTTDRPATCKYSETEGTEYDSMEGTFNTDDGLYHYVELSNLKEGKYTYYVKCKSEIDGEPVNSEDYVISFTVDLTPPTILERSPGINAVGVDPTTNIMVKFSEEVKCTLGSWENCISVIDSTGNSIEGIVTYSTDTLTFDPTNNLDSNTEFRVTLTGITDLAENELGDTEWSFITATYYSIELTPGWNLISIPTVPGDTSIDAVLGDAKNAIDSVWTYDAVNDEWYVYHPDSPETSNLDTMTAGYGYWISATEEAVIEGYGSLFKEKETPPQRVLKPGWNLIGYYQKPGEDESPVYCALSSLIKYECISIPNLNEEECIIDISEKYWTTLVTYDNYKKTFEEVTPDDYMIPGKGYWIFMKSSDIGETYMYGPGDICD